MHGDRTTSRHNLRDQNGGYWSWDVEQGWSRNVARTRSRLTTDRRFGSCRWKCRIQGRPPDRPVMRRQCCGAAGRAGCV